MPHVRCWHQPHLALAYCSLATCPCESLLHAACHTAVGLEKRPALPFAAHAYKAPHGVHRPAWSHAHQQHNTNYDSYGSKSDSTWGAWGPVSMLSNLCKRQANLNGGHPVFFYLNLAQNSAYNLYILCRFWKCTRAVVNQLWSNCPKGDLVPGCLVNFGPAYTDLIGEQKQLSMLSDKGVSIVLQGSIVPSAWLPRPPNILQVQFELSRPVLWQYTELVPAVSTNRR